MWIFFFPHSIDTYMAKKRMVLGQCEKLIFTSWGRLQNQPKSWWGNSKWVNYFSQITVL